MTSLFNYAEGQKLKKAGIEKASAFPFDEPVGRAKLIAIYLAKKNGTVCADDLHEYLSTALPNILEQLQPNSFGSIFKSPKLEFTGEIVESKRMARHCGMQRIWRYVG